jgi:hypothetical protein
MRRVSAFCALCLLTSVTVAAAQVTDPDHQPIGRFAADVRGVFANFADDPGLAEFLDVTQENLATRGLGVVFGAHVYPLRLGRYVALGLGGELMFSRGSKTLQVEEEDGDVVSPSEGPTVSARLSAVSPQFSLNFGGRDGWSYLSGGIGWTKFSSEVKNRIATTPTTPAAPAATDDTARTSTINYGGGARWFMKKHLALSLDLRFYAIRPQTGTPTRPTLKRATLLMLNAGVSFK